MKRGLVALVLSLALLFPFPVFAITSCSLSIMEQKTVEYFQTLEVPSQIDLKRIAKYLYQKYNELSGTDCAVYVRMANNFPGPHGSLIFVMETGIKVGESIYVTVGRFLVERSGPEDKPIIRVIAVAYGDYKVNVGDSAPKGDIS